MTDHRNTTGSVATGDAATGPVPQPTRAGGSGRERSEKAKQDAVATRVEALHRARGA